jgi:23S rRNA (adenine2030-N6)-methyltransferase
VAVHHRDAGEAMRALLPPALRRGLVLLDPPYEAPGEHATLVANLVAGHARFPTGIFAAWYPIKHLTPVRALHQSLQATGLRDILAAELTLREPSDPARLNGCGLIVINPPYGFAEAAAPILQALREGLSDEGGSSAVLTLVHE